MCKLIYLASWGFSQNDLALVNRIVLEYEHRNIDVQPHM